MSTDPSGLDAGDTNLYRYVGNAPTHFTDPFGLQAEGARVNDQKSLDEVVKLFKGYKEAKKLSDKAAAGAGRDPSVVLDDRILAGAYDPKNNKILIAPGMTRDQVLAALLFEMVRAANKGQYEQIEKDAADGKLSREEYGRKQERLSYTYFAEAAKVARNAVREKAWPPGCDVYSPNKKLFRTFDDFYKYQNNPANFPGKVSHTEVFRRSWDLMYREAYEKKRKKKP